MSVSRKSPTRTAQGASTTLSKRSGGRPAHQPTQKDRQMVEVLAGYAIPSEKIALVIGITQTTLRKHYGAEIARGSAVVEAKLAGNLLRLAGGSDGTALKAIMFSLQCRFGWSQYVPRIDRAPELGKKEQAQMAAETAHEESDWGTLVH